MARGSGGRRGSGSSGPGDRFGSRRAASRRSLAATRRPSRPGATRPVADRPQSKTASSPAPRRRGGREIAPQAGQRRRAAALVLSPLARQIVALGLALCAVALSLAYPLRGYLQQQTAEQQATAEQHDLEAQIADLEAQVAALKDPAYIRSEAKRRLQYVTPGDTVYVVKVPGAAEEQDSATEPDDGYDVVPDGATADAAPSAATGAAASGGAAGAATDAATPSDASGSAGGAATGTSGDEPWYASLWGTLTSGSASGDAGGAGRSGG